MEHALATAAPISLPITHVTVHPGLARIERSGPLPLEALTRPLRLTELPPLLQESSLQVRVEGFPLELVTLQPGWEVPIASASSLLEAQERVKALGRDVQRLEQRQASLEQAIQYWSSLSPDAISLQGQPLPGSKDPVPELLPSDDAWDCSLEHLERVLCQRQEQLRACQLELKKGVEAHRIASHQLQRLEAGRVPGAPRRTLTLQFASPARAETIPPEARLVLSYRVPGATWVPAYEVRTELSQQESTLKVKALVAQSTGEDWQGVRLAVSTADGTYSTELPVLPSMRIGRRQAPPARTGYRPPPEGLSALFEGYDRQRPSLPTPSKPKPKKPRVQSRVMADAELQELGVLSEAAYDMPSEAYSTLTTGGLPPPPAAGMIPQGVMPQGPPPGMPTMYGGVPPALPMSASMPPASMAPGAVGGAPPSPKRAAAPELARARSMPSKLEISADQAFKKMDKELREEGAAGAMPMLEPAPAGLEAGSQWLEFDGLRLAGPDAPGRGGLRALSPAELLEEVLPEDTSRDSVDGFLDTHWAKARATQQLTLPSMAVPVIQSKGRFDHELQAELALDVPSDGIFHGVTLRAASGKAELAYRTVPGVEPTVYRELILSNPLSAPLLTGPCDLYLGSELVATSALGRVDVGGVVRLGLGVEERIKVARNVIFKESASGMFSGSLSLDHEITLSFSSQLETAVTVEVLERIPITHQSEVEIKELSAQPLARPYDQAERGQVVRGGRRQQVALPARGQAKATLSWRAVIGNKLELAGGNRRE